MLLLTVFITFDTIDHDILLNRLETAFDIIIKGVVPEWFRLYLKKRSFTVLIHIELLEIRLLLVKVICGSVCPMPGSSLGPILFILYTNPHRR